MIILRLLAFIGVNLSSDDRIAENIYFVFYRGSINHNVSIWLPNGTSLSEQAGFDSSKTTVFFASGFTNSLDSSLGRVVLDGYLAQSEKYNLVQINYTHYSLQDYLTAVPAIPKIAEAIAKELKVMIDSGSLEAEKINLVGHSLGAQLVGNIAKHIKVPLLVGLEPAAVGFLLLTSRLQRGFANYTIEIHSDAGYYGTTHLSGDVNYLANDGVRNQPGCPTNSIAFSFSGEDVCSHNRAPYIWGYALRHPEMFMAVPCDYTGFCRGNCDMNSTVKIAPETRVYGTYFFETMGKPPYGLGTDGIRSANQKPSNGISCDIKPL